MPMKTDALIIRETKVGEADRFVTILTREHGLVRAAARGSRNIKSRRGTATSLLTYAQVTLTEGKSGYVVSEATPLRVFFDWKSDITTMSLAQYFCELCGVLVPWDEPAEETLRLLLNALHLLSEGKKEVLLIKATVELRLLCHAGYMPALGGCARCQKAEGALYLALADGRLLCTDCGGIGHLPLSPSTLAAMRYISTAPLEKVFSFTLPREAAADLAAVCEKFLLYEVNRGFKTLDFFHQTAVL